MTNQNQFQKMTKTREFVASMLFLSHSKLAIKLRYIMALYRVERQHPSESVEDCYTRIYDQTKLIQDSINEIENTKIEAQSQQNKEFEPVDIRTRSTLFTQDCGGQGKWNEWTFQPPEIRTFIKDIIYFILNNIIEYTTAIHQNNFANSCTEQTQEMPQTYKDLSEFEKRLFSDLKGKNKTAGSEENQFQACLEIAKRLSGRSILDYSNIRRLKMYHHRYKLVVTEFKEYMAESIIEALQVES